MDREEDVIHGVEVEIRRLGRDVGLGGGARDRERAGVVGGGVAGGRCGRRFW